MSYEIKVKGKKICLKNIKGYDSRVVELDLSEYDLTNPYAREMLVEIERVLKGKKDIEFSGKRIKTEMIIPENDVSCFKKDVTMSWIYTKRR